MVEADIHLRLLPKSELDISKVFEPLTCCLKGVWVHPIPIHRPSWPKILGFWVTCGVEMMPLHHGWGRYPPQTASHIHIRCTKCVWAIGILSQGHIHAPLYRYTSKGGPRFLIWVLCVVKMIPLRHGWGWQPPQTVSNIHIRHIKCVWGIVLLSQGHIGAPLYHHTS